MGFADQIELGPFRAAPNESVFVDTEYSRQDAGGASEFDDKKPSDTSMSPSRSSFLDITWIYTEHDDAQKPTI